MDKATPTGVILAGGRARRMGGNDKGLLAFNGRPLIEHIITALAPQVGAILINANRNIDHYQRYGYPVITDERGGYQGPLAGMASCLAAINSDYMLTLPCDSPYLPADLAARLMTSLQAGQAEICCAHDGQRLQPVFALLQAGLLDSLRTFLDSGGRKIDRWYAQRRLALADFSDKPDTFLNINTPADLARLQAGLESLSEAKPHD